jgi:hypothetical protein
LRHTAATLALAAGVPPKIVSEMLGRAAFTLDVYSHVVPHMQDSAVAYVRKPDLVEFTVSSRAREARIMG